MVLSCARASVASGPAATATASKAIRSGFVFMLPPLGLVREWPQAQLLLGDLPEPRQSVGLDDQEEQDEAPEDHQLDLLQERHRQAETDRMRRVRQEDRRQH